MQPRIQFLFGGYKWQSKSFGIWYVDLDAEGRAFRFRRAGRYYFIGDEPAVREARKRTEILLNSRSRDVESMDMEPFEVLRDVVREEKHAGVGGVSQIAKVYQHMNAAFFATLWEVGGDLVPHVFGRPVLPLESCSWSAFDPDSLEFRAKVPARRGLTAPNAEPAGAVAAPAIRAGIGVAAKKQRFATESPLE